MHYLLLAGMMAAMDISPASATVAEDDWQTLEQWEQETPASESVAPSSSIAKLLPSLGQTPSATSSQRVAPAPHEVDFAGLPPLFERPRATPAIENKQPKNKAPAAKPMPGLSEQEALVGRENDRRGLALTLPGKEKAPTAMANTAACTKPKSAGADQRLASDRATLAALQNAVKSVGAEQAFDLMLPSTSQKKSPPATASEIVLPEVKPLTLISLP